MDYSPGPSAYGNNNYGAGNNYGGSNLNSNNNSGNSPTQITDTSALMSQIDVPNQVRSVIMNGPNSAADSYLHYLEAVDQLRGSVLFIERELLNGKQLISRAMEKLQGDFRQLLFENSIAPNPEELKQSMLSETAPDHIRPPEVISVSALERLHAIARRLVENGQAEMCTKIYRESRMNALRQNFQNMGFERMSSAEILAMDWMKLEEKMKAWNEHMHIGMIYVAAEREACDFVFDGMEPFREQCFVDLSRPSLLLLIHFGMAAAGIRKSPEKLFTFLDMYETTSDLNQTVSEQLFAGPEGESVRVEYLQLLQGLGQAARETFEKFEEAVKEQPSVDELEEGQSPQSTGALAPPLAVRLPTLPRAGSIFSKLRASKKFKDGASELGSTTTTNTPSAAASASGNVHPLSSYVANYVIMLCNSDLPYFAILEEVFEETAGGAGVQLGMGGFGRVQNRLAFATLRILEALRINLEARASAMNDDLLSELFLMNNFAYILSKIDMSDAGRLLGIAWSGNYCAIMEQHRDRFIANTLAKFDEALGDGRLDTQGLVKRLKLFNATLERLRQRQMGWSIPNGELRAHVKQTITLRLIERYSEFITRHGSLLQRSQRLDVQVMTVPDIEQALATSFLPPLTGRR